ncbi:hypothetical protein Rrhod_3891 [Rhodococcus rhodnii LMG 5362]|uniref:Uncharacterized protein n=1 Tax=Rhodococcus rhodnii LMG 5362 TaxID=1273125 RepID=R7WI30_9NOCA|nr:hypothetical protein Rrhod_3891 [Rhodococcus rhodnii LMG 5362]
MPKDGCPSARFPSRAATLGGRSDETHLVRVASE